LLLEGKALKAELEKAKKLTQIKVSSREKGRHNHVWYGASHRLMDFMTHATGLVFVMA